MHEDDYEGMDSDMSGDKPAIEANSQCSDGLYRYLELGDKIKVGDQYQNDVEKWCDIGIGHILVNDTWKTRFKLFRRAV